MSLTSSLTRRTPTILCTRRLAFPLTQFLPSNFIPRPASLSTSPTLKMDKDQSRGESTTGISEWKQRPPYRVHEKNEDFDVKYEANCHCGKVQYQLSRREPLDSKLCHCTTCQTQHGTYIPV